MTDRRYDLTNCGFEGFPTGRSPAGNLATAALRRCLDNTTDINFKRIGKGRERSYWSSAFTEANVIHGIAVLAKLGFSATGIMTRQVGQQQWGIKYDVSSWIMHVQLGDAIKTADKWTAGEIDLEKIVQDLK